jgi:hypothetical protein
MVSGNHKIRLQSHQGVHVATVIASADRSHNRKAIAGWMQPYMVLLSLLLPARTLSNWHLDNGKQHDSNNERPTISKGSI